MSTESDAAATEGEWVFHDGEGPYAGWLFRYADGTLVTADGTVLEDATTRAPEPREQVEPTGPTGRTGRTAAPASEAGGVAEDEPEPAPEPTPVDVPEPPDDPEVADPPPEPAAPPAPAEEAPPAAQTPAAPPPDFLQWSTSAVPQVLCGVLGVAAAIGAVMVLVTSLGEGTDGPVTALGLGLLAVAGLYGVTTLAPSTVTLRGAELSVDRGGEATTFDLAEPQTVVELDEPGRSRWSARVASPGGPSTVLRRSQVDPTDFTAACRAHLARREHRHEGHHEDRHEG